MKQNKLTNEEIGTLCLSLSHLIHAGIPTGDAFVLLRSDEQEPTYKALLSRMAALADDGASLSAIFRDAACFPAYVCTLLAVGEQVGKTEETLTSLAQYYTERAAQNRHLRSVILYPAMLLVILLAVMVILLVWVLPVFNDVYAQLGSRLTGIAGGLLALGQYLGKGMPVVCGILAFACIVAAIPPLRNRFWRFWKTRQGDKGIGKTMNNARFMQALSLGINSGMTAQEAVGLASGLSQEEAPAFGKRCDRCLAQLNAGDALPQVLKDNSFLSSSHCRLLEAGTRSGNSQAVLEEITQRLSEESREDLERALGRIEPAMVAVACVLIGAVLLSVMLPLIHIMSAIG